MKWNVSYIIQENWAHRSHSKDKKKLDYWYTPTCQRKWKGFDISTCKKSIQIWWFKVLSILPKVAKGNKKWSKVFITTNPVFQFSIGCTLITDSITFGSTSVIVLVAAWDSTRVFVLLSFNTQRHQSYFPCNSFMLMTQVFLHQKFTLLPSCMIN